MTEIQIPARYIVAGDFIGGLIVSSIRNLPEGDREFKLVTPGTTHVAVVRVEEKDLRGILFPVTKRGDDYNPNPRNALLGLPLSRPVQHPEPAPIAVYPAGTRVGNVRDFDRSMKVLFHCPDHPGVVYMSKDPFVSTWFVVEASGACDCHRPTGDYIVHEDYKPTRNG